MTAAYDLRCGRYQDVLTDVEVDAVIADPPFGERTHAAWSEEKVGTTATRGTMSKTVRTAISYAHWTPGDVADFVNHWAPRCRGWIAAMTSSDLGPAYQSAYEAAGLYAFAPIPCVTLGGSVRLNGDGPASWTVWLMVARPKTRAMQKWGALPGAYVFSAAISRDGGGGGRGKPLDLMRAIVADYSRPGDLVCDPCAGYGSTLAAALQKGRRAIGSEVDPAVYAEARVRLDAVAAGPRDMFDPRTAKPGVLL